MITYITETEQRLLDDFKELQFGEVYDIEVLEDDNASRKPRELTKSQLDFVKLIRGGVRSFDQVKVHQSDPVYALVKGETKSGLRCTRMYKFN
jgi:hypothetical protein